MDVGSYGGYVNTHACSHKDKRTAHTQPTCVYYPQIFCVRNKEQRGEKTGRAGKTDRRMSPQKNSQETDEAGVREGREGDEVERRPGDAQ